MKNVVCVMVSMVAILAGASTVSATPLFYDNFEGVSAAAAFPNFTASYDPVAVNGTWAINEASMWNAQVTTDSTAPEPGPKSGSNYLAMRRAAGEAATAFYGNLTRPATSADNLLISFDVAGAGVGNCDGSSYFHDFGVWGTPGDWNTEMFDIRFQDRKTYDGSWWVMAKDAQGIWQWVDQINDQTWYHFDVAVNLTAQTYDISINGTHKLTASMYGSQTQLGGIWDWVSASTKTYFDNVQVTPEPATLMLLGLGSLLCVRRRK